MAAILCDSLGWPSVFYLFGALGLVWCAVWLIFVSNTPAGHERISKPELTYITASLAKQIDENQGDSKSIQTPWRDIIKSLPVWAIIVGHTCANFGTYLMLTSLPLFMDEVLNFDLKQVKFLILNFLNEKFRYLKTLQNGLLSAIPYIVYYVGINIAGITADYMLTKKMLSIGNMRKLMMIVGKENISTVLLKNN